MAQTDELLELTEFVKSINERKGRQAATQQAIAREKSGCGKAAISPAFDRSGKAD